MKQISLIILTLLIGLSCLIAQQSVPLPAEMNPESGPVVLQEIENISALEGSAPASLDLTAYFDDPDVDQSPVFSVTVNSFPEVASAAISENNLVIDYKEPGQTNVAVTAASNGQSVTIDFVVGVIPVITGNFETANFDELVLEENSYWNGSDGSGGIASGPAWFYNHYNPDWFSWNGWAVSNVTDNTTPGWENQYSAITGAGFQSDGASNYAVGYVSPGSGIIFSDGPARQVAGCFITNATYTALSMKYGDDYAKKFGGADGDDEDWLKLSIEGYEGGVLTNTVEFYLADFSFEDSTKDYIIETWQWVDLTSLGKVDSLSFMMSSTDVGDWGMNTPAYFCMDNLYAFPNPDEQSEYISKVHEYKPAPGQYINTAWGSPHAANTLIGGTTGSLSLGAFGGYVVFSFDHPVENHPENPYGIDFTIFGNPMPNWAEHGIISVMKDKNGNGLPDDTWYELAGSDYFFSSVTKNYEITYTNPHQANAADVPWQDNMGNSGFISAGSYHTQPHYPLHDSFPAIDNDTYTLSGTQLADPVDRSNPEQMYSPVKIFGYADSRVRGKQPYTIPDNPYTEEIENSGGDAFDISWAVNETGHYVDLDAVDFVKVHTAVLSEVSWLGEISTEITGAVDVAPGNLNGQMDVVVIADLPDTIRGNQYQLEVSAFHGGRRLPGAVIQWNSSLEGAEVDENNLLRFNTSGELTLKAVLESDPDVETVATVVLDFHTGNDRDPGRTNSNIIVYPNPASEFVVVKGVGEGRLQLYSITGELVLNLPHYHEGREIYIGNMPKGVYFMKVSGESNERIMKLLIQ
ncbi:MAG: DUF4465 domain-containing protein [Bacteroidales bacterium]|nr:DUF4465 domain-containing protein [Bacteroidales bacterium]